MKGIRGTMANDMKFTTAEDYMKDVDDKPSGGETWQTKANKAVPRYYSPTELLSMRVDKLESMIQDTMAAVVNLNKRLSNLTSDHLTPIKDEDL